ncbi:MAG TPA: O-antigen ligase family protein, partial [Ktedonobacteraceae bacterium]|nr:O-antigen ligase family protein [Ktedonobacteraceae bacterium]
MAIFFVVLNFFRDCSRQNLLLQVMLASILLFGTYGIVELFTMSIYKDKIDALVGGNMWLSAYLVLLIPVGISLTYWESKLEPRLFYGATTGIGLTCLVFSYSRAGLLAMACEALLLSWLMKKRAIGMTIVGTIVLFLGAILFFQVTYVTPRTELRGTIWEEMTATHNWEARVNIWSLAADKLWQHPVLGIG